MSAMMSNGDKPPPPPHIALGPEDPPPLGSAAAPGAGVPPPCCAAPCAAARIVQISVFKGGPSVKAGVSYHVRMFGATRSRVHGPEPEMISPRNSRTSLR